MGKTNKVVLIYLTFLGIWDIKDIEEVFEIKVMLLNKRHENIGIYSLFKFQNNKKKFDLKIFFATVLSKRATSIIIAQNFLDEGKLEGEFVTDLLYERINSACLYMGIKMIGEIHLTKINYRTTIQENVFWQM